MCQKMSTGKVVTFLKAANSPDDSTAPKSIVSSLAGGQLTEEIVVLRNLTTSSSVSYCNVLISYYHYNTST